MPRGPDVYFWRQSIVLLSDALHSVGTGFTLSFPSTLSSARAPNATTIHLTKEQISWISTVYAFTGVIGFIIVPPIMQRYGRKIAHILINLISVIGFIMIIFAQDVATLYAARIIQGLGICGVYITSMILAEYAHPKRRGYFISLKKGSAAIGSLICHSLVLICTWQQIAIVAMTTYVLSGLLTLPWTESPAFFAVNGKYEECQKSYMYLNGDTMQTRKEVEDMISAQKDRRQMEERQAKKKKLSQLCKKFTRKDFMKPFFIVAVLTAIVDSVGRYYNLAYIVQIITDITGDKSVGIYCSIGLDFLSIVACWFSSYFITRLRRRTMLFSFGYLSVGLMFLISFSVFLKSQHIASGLVWMTPCVILLNSFITNLGVIPICFAVSGEIFPLQHKGFGLTATGIVFTMLYGITMKCTPIMMDKTGIEGTYGIYGLCLMIFLIITHFIIIETKDKTLQEIEDEIIGIDRSKNETLHEREKLSPIPK